MVNTTLLQYSIDDFLTQGIFFLRNHDFKSFLQFYELVFAHVHSNAYRLSRLVSIEKAKSIWASLKVEMHEMEPISEAKFICDILRFLGKEIFVGHYEDDEIEEIFKIGMRTIGEIIDQYDIATKLDFIIPLDIKHAYRQAWVFSYVGQWQKSINLYKITLEKEPDNLLVVASLCECHLMLGQYQQCINRARNVSPSIIRYKLLTTFFATIALMLLGRRDESQALLNRLQEDPNMQIDILEISWDFSLLNDTIRQKLDEKTYNIIIGMEKYFVQ